MDALKLCIFSHQKFLYLPDILTDEDPAPPEFAMTLSERLLNSINLKPQQIEVKGSNIWKEKDMSKIEDLKTIEKTFDWTFSTPYKGTITTFSSVYD